MRKRFALPVDDIGDQEPEASRRSFESDRSTVKGPVVQDAERQPVAYIVGPSVGVPPDMCCIKSHQVVLESDIEVADGAPPLVRR